MCFGFYMCLPPGTHQIQMPTYQLSMVFQALTCSMLPLFEVCRSHM
jgi:hypothetical protein